MMDVNLLGSMVFTRPSLVKPNPIERAKAENPYDVFYGFKVYKDQILGADNVAPY